MKLGSSPSEMEIMSRLLRIGRRWGRGEAFKELAIGVRRPVVEEEVRAINCGAGKRM
jgi:uncharacterized protein YifE (UPF0438 family)